MRPKSGLAALPWPALGLLAALSVAAPASAAAPPTQPTDGPGGVGDKAATITKRAVGRASAATYAFYKAGPAPEGGRPVAVFLHAWGAPNPQAYGAWIDPRPASPPPRGRRRAACGSWRAGRRPPAPPARGRGARS